MIATLCEKKNERTKKNDVGPEDPWKPQLYCNILKQYSSIPYLRVFSLSRCVPQHDSSLALGIQWIIARCLGKSLVTIFCVLSVHLKSLLCVLNYAWYWLETKMDGKNQVIVISFINNFIMVCIIMFKGRGPGINSSQSKNVGKIQLSMQLSHLSIIFENIWF